MPAPIHLFHIGYSEATARSCPLGMQLLDNLRNPRPDWWEFWPIRQFLLGETLDDAAYYGFFSPKFQTKTGLSPEAVRAFIATDPRTDTDAYLFSTQPDVGMFFDNVFTGGEKFDPGFLATAQDVLSTAGWKGQLTDIVMDSRCTVFSNYLVARPSFWRQWLQICECVFMLAEQPALRPDLHARLNHLTSYGVSAQRKIFVIEGIASLLTAVGGVRCQAISPFAVPWFSVFSSKRAEAVAADALKIAYRDTGQVQYLDEFRALQARVLTGIFG
jgi:hypothetical protein